MRITVEVTITAYRTDGTQVQVTNGARKQAGDNPRFAGDEASEVVDAAAKAALSGFRAAVEDAAAPSRPEPPPVTAQFKAQRDYVLNAMDTVGVPLDADAWRIRSLLLNHGLDVNADDAELESFQALRRRIQAPTWLGPRSPEDTIVHLLDQAGARGGLSTMDAKKALRRCGLPIPQATPDEWSAAIAQYDARKDPER